jgi:hypothetical protein
MRAPSPGTQYGFQDWRLILNETAVPFRPGPSLLQMFWTAIRQEKTMTEEQTKSDIIIRIFSLVPQGIYFIVALLLTVVAVISVYDAILLIANLVRTGDVASGIMQVIYALLLTITVIVLFETVTVYFRTKHVLVRALLVAGLTGTIRHVLIYNVSVTGTLEILGTAVILAVLIAGIVLVKDEPLG